MLKPTPSGIAKLGLARKLVTVILLMMSVEVVNMVLKINCCSSGDVLSPYTAVLANPVVAPILFFRLERIGVFEFHMTFLLFVVWKTS